MMAKAIRQKLKKNKAPVFIVLPKYACAHSDPVVMWLPDHREPTEFELVAAIVAAGFTEVVAATAAAKIVAAREKTKPNP
jgi:hypothetical protein